MARFSVSLQIDNNGRDAQFAGRPDHPHRHLTTLHNPTSFEHGSHQPATANCSLWLMLRQPSGKVLDDIAGQRVTDGPDTPVNDKTAHTDQRGSEHGHYSPITIGSMVLSGPASSARITA